MTERSEHPVEIRARKLQEETQARIDKLCAEASPLQYESIAEQVAEEILGDEWEWRTMTFFANASPPRVVITRQRYKPLPTYTFTNDEYGYRED